MADQTSCHREKSFSSVYFLGKVFTDSDTLIVRVRATGWHPLCVEDELCWQLVPITLFHSPLVNLSVLQATASLIKGKASASRAEDPEFESCLRRDFFGVESYQ